MTQRITIQLIMDIGKLRLKFARDGFVIVPKFLNKKELMVLEQESNEAIKNNQIPATGWGAKGVDKIHPWFHKQLRTGKHVELLKALLEDDIKPVHAGFFDRTPGVRIELSQTCSRLISDRMKTYRQMKSSGITQVELELLSLILVSCGDELEASLGR